MSDTVKTMKACEACRFLKDETFRHVCTHPQGMTTVPNYLTGFETREYPSIDVARTIGECKTEAKLWEGRA